MIRNDLNNISQDEFEKIIIPAKNKIRKYVKNNLLYDYVAYRISTLYEMNAMWSGSFNQEVNSALFDIADYCTEKLDPILLKFILEKKYNIKITNDNPLEMSVYRNLCK